MAAPGGIRSEPRYFFFVLRRIDLQIPDRTSGPPGAWSENALPGDRR
jgi:hypothetical protein